MRIATNIFNSPENTGPGNFGRRLAVALEPLGDSLMPVYAGSTAPVFLGSAFLDGARSDQKTVLRIDGPGAGGDIERVEVAHKSADYVIYQSEYSKNVLQKKHGYVPKASTVICNGVVVPDTCPNNLIKDEFRLISIVHNWNKYRYPVFMDVMIRNAEAIQQHFPQLRWQVVGKFAEFRQAIGDDIPSFIEFVEFSPDLYKLRKNAHACLHLVGGDSCPNSVVESLAQGLPCIVWHDSGGPQLIEHGWAGATVSGTNPEFIIMAIEDVMGYHFVKSEAAYQLAKTQWNIDVVAARYREVFYNVLRT